MRRKVVITGLGPVSSVGCGAAAFWSSLCDGVCGLGPVTRFDAGAMGFAVGGLVEGLNIRDLVPKHYRKATKVMARDIELAVAAARLAASDAGLVTRGADEGEPGFPIVPGRTGCNIGAGQISAEAGELGRAMAASLDDDGSFSTRKWGTVGEGAAGAMDNLPPLWLLKYLPNMLACHVTIIHGCEGPSNTIMGAEAGALLSIGESTRVIERGSADVCFAGGGECRIDPFGLVRMKLAGRASQVASGEDPCSLVRAYDASSRGVIGEGGGMLIVEGAEHAAGRGARAYAEIAGFGCGMDARPMTPGLEGEGDAGEDRGLTRAIRSALRDAGIEPGHVDAIVPMAAGVAGLDARERGSLRAALGAAASRPMITVTPNTGNTMAAHGGLTTAAGALALHHQRLPARLNAGHAVEADANACATRDATLRHVLVCSGSFGGQAAAIVLRRCGVGERN